MENRNTPHKRFPFGKNWLNFQSMLTENQQHCAQKSLEERLAHVTLHNKVFLDIGCGSGLFSLAAYRLGAIVDNDQDSVNCTRNLQEKYANETERWVVTQGSVLDKNFLMKLGKVDIVYAWGVLHHTGEMFHAFENVSELVKDGGHLFLSIYNDQGRNSRIWHWIKKKYNESGILTRCFLILYTLFRQWGLTFLRDFLKTGSPFKTWYSYGVNNRGMSAYHDLIDWTGGYPFEVAKPECIFNFFQKTGFKLKYIKTCGGGVGCNEYIFQRIE
jgi:SAM-dependent methyltransferase